MKTIQPSVELLQISKDAEQLIEAAGRTCYKSENKITPTSAKVFVKAITKRGHHSVIEHAFATFRIVCDRGITHEIVRHRLASYSQESTRYVKYGDIEVLQPCKIVNKIEEELWREACENAEESYKKLIDIGVKPENARSVLPTCLKTEIVMTANFREWIHFINLRGSKAAHPDIRVIADMILLILSDRASSVFNKEDE
ncbi:MAG: FAD-dependent thymidylate synthase [Lutibacter sp.]|nr:FAD-dependent thymidylate synthase [Lutibacter sp.]